MRAILMVIDGFGIGEAPDASVYGDEGSNTLVNLYNKTNLILPNFKKLGLYNIDGVNLSTSNHIASVARLRELSIGKDTTTGHYEMMGIFTKEKNPTFDKFPDELIQKIEKTIGTKTIGNYAQSGTVILNELGEEHLKTGYPIIYTSSDSVLQVATHVDKYSIEKLYDMCDKIRKLCTGKYAVGRIIARPFDGTKNNFIRLPYRKDFALPVPNESVLDLLKNNQIKTISVGKVFEVFNGQGICLSLPGKDNKGSQNSIVNAIENNDNCFIFANLVDTDMLYGHRNDIEGYKNALQEIDNFLPILMDKMSDQDILLITGDHGCDPTTSSTNHSREYTPLIVYSKNIKRSANLGTLNGFDNCGNIVLEFFGLKNKNILEKLNYER